jgi:hypothetical protein
VFIGHGSSPLLAARDARNLAAYHLINEQPDTTTPPLTCPTAGKEGAARRRLRGKRPFTPEKTCLIRVGGYAGR